MTAYQVLVGTSGPDGWSAFQQTVQVTSASEARDAVLSHPDAAASQWRVIRVTEVELYPVAS